MTVSRREFLGGMLAVIVLPKTLEGLDFPEPKAEFPEASWFRAFADGEPLTATLTQHGEEIPGVARQVLSFAPARQGIIVNDAPLEWPELGVNATIDGLRVFDSDGEWLFDGEVQMNTRYVMALDSVSFPVESIAVTFG